MPADVYSCCLPNMQVSFVALWTVRDHLIVYVFLLKFRFAWKILHTRRWSLEQTKRKLLKHFRYADDLRLVIYFLNRWYFDYSYTAEFQVATATEYKSILKNLQKASSFDIAAQSSSQNYNYSIVCPLYVPRALFYHMWYVLSIHIFALICNFPNHIFFTIFLE